MEDFEKGLTMLDENVQALLDKQSRIKNNQTETIRHGIVTSPNPQKGTDIALYTNNQHRQPSLTTKIHPHESKMYFSSSREQHHFFSVHTNPCR